MVGSLAAFSTEDRARWSRGARQRPTSRRDRGVLRTLADEAIARAAVRVFRGCIDDVLVYEESNRLTLALYRLNEGELGQPLRPSRICSKLGRAFWASRR